MPARLAAEVVLPATSRVADPHRRLPWALVNATRGIAVSAGTAVTSAAFVLGQVVVAELAGITTLDADFAAGAERTVGVQVTLVVWYCAVAAVVAVALAAAVAGARSDARADLRLALVVPAMTGPPAALPFLTQHSGAALGDDLRWAVVAGTALGALASLAAVVIPAIGRSIAAHAVLLWVAALASTALVTNTVVYAGMVEPLGSNAFPMLRDRIRLIVPAYAVGYHLPSMLPVGLAVVALSSLLAVRVRRAGGSGGAAMSVAAAGPLLAASAYWLTPDQQFLWNEAAATIVLGLALCSLAAAGVATGIVRPSTA